MTRQRITGTLVLLLVAVVLLPAIFDGQGSYQLPPTVEIPAAPPLPEVPENTARRPDIMADSEAIRVDRSGRQPTPVPLSGSEASSEDSAQEMAEESADDTAVERADSAASAGSPTQATAASQSSPSPPTLDHRGLPEAWSVRLGAFSNRDNVNALVQRLQAAGHPAYTRSILSAQGQLTGVFVGPKVDRSAAQQLQAELRQHFQLEGQVVRYEIEEQ